MLINNSIFAFETTALHPHSKASREISGLAVNVTTGRSGLMRDNSRAASGPFITGIERSRSTKSGLRSATFSIPSRPLQASPATTQPDRVIDYTICFARSLIGPSWVSSEQQGEQVEWSMPSHSQSVSLRRTTDSSVVTRELPNGSMQKRSPSGSADERVVEDFDLYGAHGAQYTQPMMIERVDPTTSPSRFRLERKRNY
jgi:hypothetical protein